MGEFLICFLFFCLGAIAWIVSIILILLIKQGFTRFMLHFIGSIVFLFLTYSVFTDRDGGFQVLWSGIHYEMWVPFVAIWFIHAVWFAIKLDRIRFNIKMEQFKKDLRK